MSEIKISSLNDYEMTNPRFGTLENDVVMKDDYEMTKLRLAGLENDVDAMRTANAKRLECHTRRILDLDDRTAFIGKMLCVCLFLSVISIVLSALI